MKNTIIRFEDLHGTYDIFMKSLNLTVIKTYEFGNIVVKQVSDNVFIQNGLSLPKVLQLNQVDIDIYNKLNITDIIILHDVDNISGDKRKIMTYNQFKNSIKRAKKFNLFVKFNIYYLPTIYAAESLLMYCLFNINSDIKEFVCSWNTNRYHLELIKKQLNITDDKGGKNIIHYFSREDIRNSLRNELESSHTSNKEVIKFILDGPEVDNKLLTSEEVLKLLDELNTYYDNKVQQVDDTIRIDGKTYTFYEKDKCLKLKE